MSIPTSYRVGLLYQKKKKQWGHIRMKFICECEFVSQALNEDFFSSRLFSLTKFEHNVFFCT